METQTLKTPLNNIQLELLKLFSRDLSEKDLLAIKRLLVKSLAEKATRLADEKWEEKGWTNENMKRFVNTHIRIK
ncbi:MAG TPA: hypothetical protein ENJ95_17305 [Bacteroidetes bacterium]|nr:hypothetical protein [Bacteroidota bacterium]